MTETPVFRAICKSLEPLQERGFQFTKRGDNLCVRLSWWYTELPTRDLIEAMAEGDDPREIVAGMFDDFCGVKARSA